MSLKTIGIVLIGLLAAIPTAQACTSVAVVSGYVTCEGIGSVVGANVTVQCVETGVRANTTSGVKGSYMVSVCCPAGGHVTLTAEKEGLKRLGGEGNMDHEIRVPATDVDVGFIRTNADATIPEFPSYVLSIITSIAGIGFAMRRP